MSINVLTWNIYYGNRDGLSPEKRLQDIFTIACNKNIDLILLQEFNGCEKDVSDLLINSQYSYRIIPECSANFLVRASTSNRHYLIIYKTNLVISNDYFHEGSFIDNRNRQYLRSPIEIVINKDNKQYNFYLLHSEAWKEYAQMTIKIWKQLINSNPNLILLGDLNLEVKDIPLDNSYIGFSDKLDHIITKNSCNQIDLTTYPKSDYHFPIAAKIISQY